MYVAMYGCGLCRKTSDYPDLPTSCEHGASMTIYYRTSHIEATTPPPCACHGGQKEKLQGWLAEYGVGIFTEAKDELRAIIDSFGV